MRHPFALGALSTLALLAGVLAAGCGDEDSPASAGQGGGASVSSASAGGGGGGGSGGGVEPPEEVPGCTADVKLWATAEDPAARGPAPVGVKTVSIDGLTTEIWYPAELGSDAGEEPVVYDLRDWLPASEQDKIPDEAAPRQPCGCFRDLPLDGARGPYPVIIFLHGTAGFRTQSLAHMEHWASRGFVVLAADHPGLYLADALDFNLSSDLPGDTQRVLDALVAPAGELAFLAGRIDLTRIGLSGHSAGGGGIEDFGSAPGVRVLIPLAAGGVTPSATLESTLIMGGVNDQVVDYANQTQGYADAAPPKRLVGVGNTGHLFPTDLCWMTNASGQDIVTTATMYDIKNANLASQLFDCPPDQLAREVAREIVNYATTAAFEEKLTCKAGDPFATLQAKYPDVAELEEQLQ
jgi:dienelactone hydrolase